MQMKALVIVDEICMGIKIMYTSCLINKQFLAKFYLNSQLKLSTYINMFKCVCVCCRVSMSNCLIKIMWKLIFSVFRAAAAAAAAAAAFAAIYRCMVKATTNKSKRATKYWNMNAVWGPCFFFFFFLLLL